MCCIYSFGHTRRPTPYTDIKKRQYQGQVRQKRLVSDDDCKDYIEKRSISGQNNGSSSPQSVGWAQSRRKNFCSSLSVGDTFTITQYQVLRPFCFLRLSPLFFCLELSTTFRFFTKKKQPSCGDIRTSYNTATRIVNKHSTA